MSSNYEPELASKLARSSGNIIKKNGVVCKIILVFNCLGLPKKLIFVIMDEQEKLQRIGVYRMTPHLIFDGYNLIYSSTFSKHYHRKDNSLQAKREQLIEIVAKYIKGKNLKATIVFDSPNHHVSAPYRGKPRKLTVAFAHAHENADERIVKLALKARPRGVVTVISSDEAHIGGFLRGCGVNVLKVEDFWSRIYKKQPAKGIEDEAIDKPQSISEDEVAYWERIFSG